MAWEVSFDPPVVEGVGLVNLRWWAGAGNFSRSRRAGCPEQCGAVACQDRSRAMQSDTDDASSSLRRVTAALDQRVLEEQILDPRAEEGLDRFPGSVDDRLALHV